MVANASKELGLRVREGRSPRRTALKTALGLERRSDTDRGVHQRGGPDAAAAIDQMFDALRAVEESGGNTQAVIAALFGGPGEDLGAALYALDIDRAAAALNGVDGAAGLPTVRLQTSGRQHLDEDRVGPPQRRDGYGRHQGRAC